jgi:hypothetical protein
MIKPESYWALHKHSDPLTLGRVGVALAGRATELDPQLSPAEAALVAVIKQDGEWFDERIEKQRERWKERQSKSRRDKSQAESPKGKNAISAISNNVTPNHALSRNVTVTKRDNEGVTPNHALSHEKCQCHDTSLPPSPPPSNTLSNESVCITRAPAQESDSADDGILPMQTPRVGIPTEKTVLAAVTAMGVTEAFARWWYREMTARDWTNTNGSRITNLNWRPTLKAWYNRAKPEELAECGRQEAKRRETTRHFAAEDWALCAERCARFRDGRCTAGAKVPPNCQKPPMPPEECKGFLVVS